MRLSNLNILFQLSDIGYRCASSFWELSFARRSVQCLSWILRFKDQARGTGLFDNIFLLLFTFPLLIYIYIYLFIYLNYLFVSIKIPLHWLTFSALVNLSARNNGVHVSSRLLSILKLQTSSLDAIIMLQLLQTLLSQFKLY